MTPRKGLLYVAVVLVIMLDTLRRIFVGSRPIDVVMLVVELLVLLLIAYEVGSGVWHKLKMRHRRSALLPYLEKGQKLLLGIPDQALEPHETVERWMQEVESWTSETRNFLDEHSPNASFAFMSTVRSGTVERAARRSDGTTFRVTGSLGDAYQHLQTKLDNLRRIIEEPDVYF